MTKASGQPRALILIHLLVGCLLITSPLLAQTFSWSRISDLPSLDPHAHVMHDSQGFLQNVYESLVDRGADLDLEPALATAWQRLSGSGWRFTLRQNVRFHDGAEFSAEDVAFSFNRASSESRGRPAWITQIDEVRVVDDYTVDFMFSGHSSELPLAALRLMVMDRGWTEKNVAQPVEAGDMWLRLNANGTGPYRIVKRDPGVSTKLQPFSQWWGQNSSNIASALFVPIGHSVTAMAALLAGEVDLITVLSPEEALLFRNRSGFTLHEPSDLNSLPVDAKLSGRELQNSEPKDAVRLIWVSSDRVTLTRRRDDVLLLHQVIVD